MNPTYPYIDAGTSCKITGMIAVVDNYTRIVAGHGLLGNTAGPHEIPGHAHHFARSRSEITVRAGRGRRKAFADLDPVWGQGIINSDQWIQIVDLTP